VVAAQILAECGIPGRVHGLHIGADLRPRATRGARDGLDAHLEGAHPDVLQVEMADIAIVLDETLLGVVDVKGRIRNGGIVIINTCRKPRRRASTAISTWPPSTPRESP
jgi:hypothetical protein